MTDPQPARIAELPAAVADAIAAGEVIERPAAAVKELLENACDAGARRIEVEIDGAGLERILVRDDGAGMRPEDLPLAFRRHATSKLRRLDDLTRLHSYGFRGEALPSMAAVAGVDCVSRRHDASLGARLRLHGAISEDDAAEPAGAPPGTTVELRDLFARQPARRRFLPGPRSERAAIARVCGEAALARPEIALQLRVEGRSVLGTPGLPSAPRRETNSPESGPDAAPPIDDLEARRPAFAAIWGSAAAAAAIAFRGERELEDGAGTLRVAGLAARPAYHRGRRDAVRLFVNGRPISSRALQRAVEQAYAELLPGGRYPIAAVFLDLPPGRVDANVHPAKATVKLADERAVFALLQRSLREALLALPSLTPGLSGPPDPRPAGPLPAMPGLPAMPPDFLRREPAPAPSSEWEPAQARRRALRLAGERPAPLRAAPGASTTLAPAGLSPAGLSPATAGGLPLLRLVGQLRATFIVAEGPDGMLLIDQHAAHERVVYERLLAARGSPGGVQQALLEPLLLELTVDQAAALAGHDNALHALGFTLEPFGDRALRVRTVPAVLMNSETGAAATRASLEAVLDDLAGAPVEAAHHDTVAASAACHGSVRAGMTLAPEEMTALLHNLEACDNPHTCPHGRPTFIGFPAADLERQFGRR